MRQVTFYPECKTTRMSGRDNFSSTFAVHFDNRLAKTRHLVRDSPVSDTGPLEVERMSPDSLIIARLFFAWFYDHMHTLVATVLRT